jgi:hypothetical protein
MKQMGFTRQSVASGGVDDVVGQIQAQANALLALSATGGVVTADGTEQTLYIDDEPLGCWEPLTLFVDLDNMQAGDTTVIRVYHRMNDAGTLKPWSYSAYTGADGGFLNGEKLAAISLKPNRHGFRATLQQTGGVNRAYDWELFARA